MSILIINAGSTSLKYALFENQKELDRGAFEIKDSNYEKTIKQLLRQQNNLQDITVVGHRIVHGGHKFVKPTLINDEVISNIESFNNLAPLHNPFNLACVKIVREYLPDIPHVAVFDTAFFSSLPAQAKIYALPKKITEKYEIYRYGFHGLSHEYAMNDVARQLNRDAKQLNLITCHLGGGGSIAAIKQGQPIDISMGWTPMEGLVMMTRSGDLGPGIVLELLKILPGEVTEEKVDQLEDLLNHHSGMKGLSGISDFRELLKQLSLGDEDAKLAFDIAIYRIVKYIGAYWAILGGQLDAIAFTGAIGAGNPITRNQVINKLKFLTNVEFLVVKPDEEFIIYKNTIKLFPEQ